jgi:limonene-1,2-epoxide hydrolase
VSTPDEAANIMVVQRLMDAFQEETPQPQNVAALLADDAYVKWSQTDPAAIGRTSILEELRRAMKPGAKFRITVYDTYAAGSVVINKRADEFSIDGKLMPPVNLMGFFVLDKGKVKTWLDYIIRDTDKPE